MHTHMHMQVCRGTTGHTEAVQMTYDPREVSYDQLCGVFFDKINPLQKGGQGNDWGSQYRTGIYYHDELQKEVRFLWLRACGCLPACCGQAGSI